VMLVGIAVSNSILIVEFTRHLREEGMDVRTAVGTACRVRLRPVLMTDQDDPFQVLVPLPLGPHGVFEFRGVPPGRYTAFAVHQNDEDDSMTFLSSVEKLEIQGNVDDLKLEYFSRK